MLPDARIALIEAGRDRLGLTTKVPGIAFVASTFAKQNWNYQTEPVPALNSSLRAAGQRAWRLRFCRRLIARRNHRHTETLSMPSA
jgi:hypothetical protein